MNFYERQRENRRQTWLLISIFSLLFVVLGLGLDFELSGFSPEEADIPIFTLCSLAFASGLSAVSYFKGSSLVMNSLMALPLDERNPEHQQFRNIAKEMAIASGLPLPTLYVIPDPSPNALATGRDPAHAAIAITQGALTLLDREETQGVIAHEMAHIANRDTLLMTVVAVLLGGVMMLSDWGRRSMYFARSEGRRQSPWVGLMVMALLLISPLVSRLLAMSVSRQREYLADATAVEFTRNSNGLARALEKIATMQSPLRYASRGTAHLFIADPLKRKINDRTSKLAELLSTHPPLARRIAVLRGPMTG